jgi:hypothetical protein
MRPILAPVTEDTGAPLVLRCRMVIVEILNTDERRVTLIATVAVALIVCALVGFALLTRPGTQFEREQTIAEASNPKWLKVEITTSDNRHEYHEGEPILVIVQFSSVARGMYKADAADGGGRAAASDTLHISNGQVRPRNLTGVACCGYRLIGLNDEPFTPPSRTPLRLAPGEYEIYLTSRRVFKWDVTGMDPYHPSSFEVASNMLKVDVLGNAAGPHQ